MRTAYPIGHNTDVSLVPAREAGKWGLAKGHGRENTDTPGQQSVSTILYEGCGFVDSFLNPGLTLWPHMMLSVYKCMSSFLSLLHAVINFSSSHFISWMRIVTKWKTGCLVFVYRFFFFFKIKMSNVIKTAGVSNNWVGFGRLICVFTELVMQ